MCASYGTQGHYVQERTVKVGYSCEKHIRGEPLDLKRKGKIEDFDRRRRREEVEGWGSEQLYDNHNTGPGPMPKTDVKPVIPIKTGQSDLAVPSGTSSQNSEATFRSVHDPIGSGEQEDININYDSDHSTSASQIWTEEATSATSISTAPVMEIASAELVSLIVKHQSLKDLYAPTITSRGQADVREALRSALKAYSKALKTGAKKPQEYKAGELVRSHARRVAYACVAFHDPSAPSIDLNGRWEALHRQKIQAAFRVEDFLNSSQENQISHDRNPEDGLVELSDDSEGEDAGDPLPNLGKVKDYMTSGEPFEQLCRDVRSLTIQTSDHGGLTVPTAELERPLVADKAATERSESSHYSDDISKTVALCGDVAPRTQKMLTSQQVLSTTDCGVMLYEDYATSNPEIIAKLSLLVNKPITATTKSSNRTSNVDFQTTRVSTVLPTNNLAAPSSSDEDSRVTKKFFAICINTGRFHKTLGEIDVTNVRRDSEAFCQIKARYLKVRSFRARARRLFLLRANSVHFVKLNVEDTYRADIIENPSIPPHTEVHAKRYDYSPLDLPLPPITSNSFLHYLSNPSCTSLTRTSRWLGCLPKRLEEQLLSKCRSCEPDTIVSGWGIHIEEGVNEEALAILALLVLGLSALLGVAYSARTGGCFEWIYAGGKPFPDLATPSPTFSDSQPFRLCISIHVADVAAAAEHNLFEAVVVAVAGSQAHHKDFLHLKTASSLHLEPLHHSTHSIYESSLDAALYDSQLLDPKQHNSRRNYSPDRPGTESWPSWMELLHCSYCTSTPT
ncbi:hypothetical protein G7Y89_g9432 [Cudoniella acicularis]|uniref:Uncharacterized protein n=1 Tax=Cudoniella acicularis TaxID=354080 RepID=A0A8H4RHB4_9HELO|nr:hypothetical protein G7Y89_g9432 [Cudoniella acicularis]